MYLFILWLSEWLLFNTRRGICLAMSWQEQVTYRRDDGDVRFVLNQQFSWICIMVVYWNNSPGRHVTPLGHSILNPSQPVFALTPKCCMLSGEATNTNFIVFGLSGQRLGPTVYCTRSEDAIHYIIDACTSIMNEVYYYFEISSPPQMKKHQSPSPSDLFAVYFFFQHSCYSRNMCCPLGTPTIHLLSISISLFQVAFVNTMEYK
jgi:hypothetical protein